MGDKRNGLHDWLSASAYVKGPDQTARVVSKKKHRSKRNPSTSDSESERLEVEQRIRALWKLSNRHYRRWMNDRLLRELAPPLDAQEIGSLFAPPPWGEKSVASPFERISAFGEGSVRDVAAWEPFRNNVDMDVEAKALQHEEMRPHCKKLGNEASRHKAALAAWQNMSHKSRDVLRRSSSWHLVSLFEEKILDFVKEEDLGGSSALILDVDDPYHRMLIHGICEFHGLVSQTVSYMEDSEGNGASTAVIRMHVKRRLNSKGAQRGCQPNLPVALMQFLTEAKKAPSCTCSGA